MGLTGVRLLFALTAVGAAIFTLGRTASAAHVQAEVSAPTAVQLGERADIRVTLRSADTGLALRDIPVTLSVEASFRGVTDWVEVGHSVTDGAGVVAFEYEPRLAGDHKLRIEYVAPGQTEPEAHFTTVPAAGDSQSGDLVAGTKTAWLNGWLVVPVALIISQIPTLSIIPYWRRLPGDRHRGVRPTR